MVVIGAGNHTQHLNPSNPQGPRIASTLYILTLKKIGRSKLWLCFSSSLMKGTLDPVNQITET